MHTISLQSHIGDDGMLNLRIPSGMANTDVEVTVIVRPLAPEQESSEAKGWPPGFFEATFGSLEDFPEIESEGDYEVREEMA
jgi:hypothetical protein